MLVDPYPVGSQHRSQHQSQQESHKSQWKPGLDHGQYLRQQQKRQKQLATTMRRESRKFDQLILKMISQMMKEPSVDAQIPPTTVGHMGITFPCYTTV